MILSKKINSEEQLEKDARKINYGTYILGIILSIIGAIGWVVSVVLAIITLGATKTLAYIFGILFIASLPIAVVCELIRLLKNKNKNENIS